MQKIVICAIAFCFVFFLNWKAPPELIVSLGFLIAQLSFANLEQKPVKEAYAALPHSHKHLRRRALQSPPS